MVHLKILFYEGRALAKGRRMDWHAILHSGTKPTAQSSFKMLSPWSQSLQMRLFLRQVGVKWFSISFQDFCFPGITQTPAEM